MIPMKHESGKVYIVGAGPGDPGLITVKGLQKLKEADVVVYDRLVNDDLMSYCRDDCEKIFVGKESGYHPVEQNRITEILIIKSRLGLNVVRLKGGNPFIFGRGSEEAIGLRDAGVDFEIIPGITAGLSAPVYSGIPITHRGLISQCVLITAHESPDKPGTQVEWEKLAQLKNASLVIYMGASRIEKICSELIRHGADRSTPAAVIENGTLPKQRTLTARLDCLAQEFKARGFHAPAIIMISPTVAMRDQILWYEKKPLFGKRIVAAGYDFQLKRLRGMVHELGGEILPLYLSDPAPFNPCSSDEDEGVWRNTLDDGPTSTAEAGYPRSEIAPGGFPAIAQPEVKDSIQMEKTNAMTRDIEVLGADMFVFTSPHAVGCFFRTFGFDTAVETLKRGIPIAINEEVAGALAAKGVRGIELSPEATIEGIYTLLLNHVPDSQG